MPARSGLQDALQERFRVLFVFCVGAQDWIYTVVDGDNLWNLIEQHLDRGF